MNAYIIPSRVVMLNLLSPRDLSGPSSVITDSEITVVNTAERSVPRSEP
jgi:hypothetical protein